MRGKQSYIPYKVIMGYLLLISLLVFAGYLIYSENKSFSLVEKKIEIENKKILKVSALFSKMNETESQARLTILSNSQKDYKNYITQNQELERDIDTLKTLLTTKYQMVLLDSVQYLLLKKTSNIEQLKIIKNKATEEIAVKKAINDLTKMEVSLRKLRLEDFVKDPSAMGDYQRSVLIKYVNYLNSNIKSDDSNTLSQKALDSMLVKSRELLSDVKRQTFTRNENLNKEEKKLLQNELSISEQLRKIIRLIENEIILNTTKNSLEKENSLKKTNEVITITAIVGLLLTVFFSVLILSDFSKSQSYKKQLELANLKAKNLLRNREQLIATVSHDLKTPLNTIMGYNELLGNSELTTKQLYFTNTIKNSSEYISNLVKDLVDLTQIEAGKIVLENSPFSLSELLLETAQSIQSVYSTKQIDLQFAIDEKLKQNIISDAFRLKQILTNIIGNAYKFTETGFIKISATISSNDQKVSISVHDSGIGIEDSQQELIFEEFTQANDGIEKRYGGTGLGLTISKKLTEILGGNLVLESNLKEGSKFTIQIPIQFDSLKIPNVATQIAVKTIDLKIIIIDDDTSLLQLTNEILRQNNFQTFPFSKAEEALQFSKNTDFDLILTDIQMPEIDGFQFVTRLQNEDNLYKNQPIIAITGRTDLPNSDYILAGFKTVIAKPYVPQKLLKVITSVLNNHESASNSDNVISDAVSGNYSLESLKTFFPDDSKIVQEVLMSFMVSTKENIAVLEQLILDKNLVGIQEIAHKMYPMFRQINSLEIGNLLESLEKHTSTIEGAKARFELIKEKIMLLFTDLEKELN